MFLQHAPKNITVNFFSTIWSAYKNYEVYIYIWSSSFLEWIAFCADPSVMNTLISNITSLHIEAVNMIIYEIYLISKSAPFSFK